MISACQLFCLCMTQSAKLGSLNWLALRHHLAEIVNVMICEQAYMCFFRIWQNTNLASDVTGGGAA